MHQPETGDAVARIFDEAQERQQVLDVGGIEKFQPTEFDERNVAPGELHLERAGVLRGAEQHRLLLQEGAGFAVFENPFDDAARLVGRRAR